MLLYGLDDKKMRNLVEELRSRWKLEIGKMREKYQEDSCNRLWKESRMVERL